MSGVKRRPPPPPPPLPPPVTPPLAYPNADREDRTALLVFVGFFLLLVVGFVVCVWGFR
jgi:hypothetical protein